MINRNVIARSVLIPALGLILYSCGTDTASQGVVLKIVATGNVQGEIEPCG